MASSGFYPPASKASSEVANLTVRKNHIKNDIVDPFDKLKKKMEGKKSVIQSKKDQQEDTYKSLKKIKKKKSAGSDGLSQEQLVLGANSRVDPLLDIIPL